MDNQSRRAHTATVHSVAAFVFACAATAAAAPGEAAENWPTFDGNPSRAAWLQTDRSITRQNVGTLKEHWVATLDATADSTPIYAAHVPGHGRNASAMLFQTDGTGKTYGIDAATGTIVWRYPTTGPNITASTPVLDPSGAYVYVPAVDGYVHKLSAATGTETGAPGFPAEITLSPNLEKDASPLNLANGYLYAATSGYFGDAPPYDGHIVAVRLSDGKTRVFNSLCSNLHMLLQGSQCTSVRSGIWARGGVVVDPDPAMKGRIYFSTGNGPYARNQHDLGDSTVALDADGSGPMDSFTPTDYLRLDDDDLDLGSTAPAMLPTVTKSTTPDMAVQGGKGAVLYLLNRAHLGRVGGELQDYTLPTEVFTAPAVWTDASGRIWIFIGLMPDSGVLALNLTTNASGISRLHAAWSSQASGTSPDVINGVIFVASSGNLEALDARNGSELWTSTSPSSGGTIGAIHWESPVAVDGAVYVSDGSSHLTAYTPNGQ